MINHTHRATDDDSARTAQSVAKELTTRDNGSDAGPMMRALVQSVDEKLAAWRGVFDVIPDPTGYNQITTYPRDISE